MLVSFRWLDRRAVPCLRHSLPRWWCANLPDAHVQVRVQDCVVCAARHVPKALPRQVYAHSVFIVQKVVQQGLF